MTSTFVSGVRKLLSRKVSTVDDIARRTVFIGIEHKEREFLPKIFASRELALRNFRVFLGSSEAVYEACMGSKFPAIFFHKSTHPGAKNLKRRGHLFVFLDEEGGVTTPYSTIEDFCEWRYKTLSKELHDLVMVPSESFRKSIAALPNSAGVKLANTGWPRVDLWDYKYQEIYAPETQDIRNRFGKFFLLVSSFGAASERSFEWLLKHESPTEGFKIITGHKREGFRNYVSLIKSLSEKIEPDEQIVVRPHPSESLDDWRKIFSDLNNVLVLREGDIQPWINASQGTIHYGSTSATQTVLSKKPAVQFKVSQLRGVTDSPSFELVRNAQSVEEVLSVLRDTSSDSLDEAYSRAMATIQSNYLDSYASPAVERVSDELEKLGIEPSPFSKLAAPVALKIWALHKGSNLKSKFKRFGLYRSNLKTIDENLPGGIGAEECLVFVERFDKLYGATNSISVSRVASNLVVFNLLGPEVAGERLKKPLLHS